MGTINVASDICCGRVGGGVGGGEIVHLQLSSSLASFVSVHAQTSLVPTLDSSGGWFVRPPSELSCSILISFMNCGKELQLFTMCGAQAGTRTENLRDSSQTRHFLSQLTQRLTAKNRMKMHQILY
jgi:hypothetical protein